MSGLLRCQETISKKPFPIDCAPTLRTYLDKLIIITSVHNERKIVHGHVEVMNIDLLVFQRLNLKEMYMYSTHTLYIYMQKCNP